MLTPSQPPDPHEPQSGAPASFHLPSFHNIIVFLLSAVQTISSIALTLIHSYKRAVHGIQIINQHHYLRHPNSNPSKPSPVPSPPTPSTPVTAGEKDIHLSHAHSVISDHSPTLSGAENPLVTSTTALTDNGLSSSVPFVPHLQLPPSPSPPPPPHYPLPAALTRLRPAPTDLAQAPVKLFVELFTLRRRYAGSAVALLIEMLQAGFTPFLDRSVIFFPSVRDNVCIDVILALNGAGYYRICSTNKFSRPSDLLP